MVIVRVCGRTEQAVEERVTWEERELNIGRERLSQGRRLLHLPG